MLVGLQEVVDDRSGLHEAHEPVLLRVDVEHAVREVVQQHLGARGVRQALEVAVERVHAAREVLGVVEQQLTSFAEAHRGGLVEARVAGDVHAAVDDHAHRVHVLGHAVRAVRDVFGDEGLDVDATHVLLPRVDTEAVELCRGQQVEEVAHEHLALRAIQVDFLAECQAAAERPVPEHLRVTVWRIEHGTELAAVAGRNDARHVDAEGLVITLLRFEDEGCLVTLFERELLRATDMVGVRVGDE